MYRIANWNELYEVDRSGRRWKEGHDKYSGPLKYIRSPVHGRKWGTAYRKLLNMSCGQCHHEGVLGVFHKLREFAADLPADMRDGRLIDGEGNPYTIETISQDSGFNAARVAIALDVLVQIGWVTAENCGTPQKTAIITEHNRTEQNTSTVLSAKRKKHGVGCFFEEWWKEYPVKRNKRKAHDIWKRKKLDEVATDLINDVKRRITNDDQWKRGFIPHPTTYLNGNRWEDELGDTAIAPAQPTEHNPFARLPAAISIATDVMKTGGDFQDAQARLREEGFEGIVIDKAWEDAKLKRKQDESLDVCLHPESSNHECEQCWIEHPERHDKWGTRANCKAKTRRE